MKCCDTVVEFPAWSLSTTVRIAGGCAVLAASVGRWHLKIVQASFCWHRHLLTFHIVRNSSLKEPIILIIMQLFIG
jgi:hypothetical protein